MAEVNEDVFGPGAGHGPAFAVPWHPFFTEAEYHAGLALVMDDDEARTLARQLASEENEPPGGDVRAELVAFDPDTGAAEVRGPAAGASLVEDTLILISLASAAAAARVEEYYRRFGITKGPAWTERRAALRRELEEERGEHGGEDAPR